MNMFNRLFITLLACQLFILTSCNEDESYADLLNAETSIVNNFLADQRIVNEIPNDSNFIYGADAPYYRMEKDGNIYMQVINPGSKDNKAKEGELINFRFRRYDLYQYIDSLLPELWFGNSDDFDYKNTEFRFGNYTQPSSSRWGTAIQLPLYYLGIDCEVNLVIKSQYGYTDEISNVVPYLYNVRYFRRQI